MWIHMMHTAASPTRGNFEAGKTYHVADEFGRELVEALAAMEVAAPKNHSHKPAEVAAEDDGETAVVSEPAKRGSVMAQLLGAQTDAQRDEAIDFLVNTHHRSREAAEKIVAKHGALVILASKEVEAEEDAEEQAGAEAIEGEREAERKGERDRIEAEAKKLADEKKKKKPEPKPAN